MAGSRAVWRARHEVADALLGSAALRAAARAAGYDVWDLIAPELQGIATLQFPWSARAMDEAGAAMELARPRLVLTYAEAGGWGRAIMLEARRRGIPCAGIQHGFIYRRWLNYLHERDEMRRRRVDAADDRGFPRPDLTVVFDRRRRAPSRDRRRVPDDRRWPSPAARGSTCWPLASAAIGPADARGGRVTALGLADGDRAAVVVSKRAQLGRWLPTPGGRRSARPGRVSAGRLGTHAAGRQAASGRDRRRLRAMRPRPQPRPSRLAPAALDLRDAAGRLRPGRHRQLHRRHRRDGARHPGPVGGRAQQPDAVRGRRRHRRGLPPERAAAGAGDGCCGTRRRGRSWSRRAWRAPNPAGCGPTAGPPAGRGGARCVALAEAAARPDADGSSI